MSRCQHCNKLTHSEHLFVEYELKDQDKVIELSSLQAWRSKFQYSQLELSESPHNEYGKLKCGDIWIHFIVTNG